MPRPATTKPVAAGITVPAAASPQLVAIGRKLIGETERLVEKILEMIRDIPEYRFVKDEALWNEVRQILRVNVPVFLSAVIEGRVPRDEEVSAARYFARRRVRQGIPLRGHLTAYRNGMWMLWEELVGGVMHRPALQRELLMRAAWAFQHLDIITSAVSEAYFAEQEGRARHRDQILRDLFDEIIGGGSSSTEDLKARAEAVGLDLDATFHVIVLGPRAGKSVPRGMPLPSAALAVAVAEAAGLTVERVVSVERNRELLLVTPPRGEEMSIAVLRSKLAEALAPTVTAGLSVVVGISGLVTGVDGVRQGYKEARRSIELGQSMQPSDFVYFYEDFLLNDVLDSGAKAGKRLISGALGPLLELGDTGQRLIDTLEAYFRASSNLKVAAGMLDIHPNTLAYRMRQIHQLTGLDANDPEHRLRAEIALRLHLLHLRREPAAAAEGASPEKAGRGHPRRSERAH